MKTLVAVGAVTFACGAALAAFAFVNPFDWAWLGTPSATSTASSSEPRAPKVKYWQAPMDPTYIRDEPGKSPMGMDLIPVYEGEAEEPAAGTVRIDPTFVQNIGVQTEPVRRTDIPFTIRTVGNVTYNDQLVSWVNTKYERLDRAGVRQLRRRDRHERAEALRGVQPTARHDPGRVSAGRRLCRPDGEE